MKKKKYIYDIIIKNIEYKNKGDNMTNDEIEELVGLTEKEFDRNFLKTRKNGLLLTDNQVSTLERFSIDASKCNSMTELLYMIDSTLDGYDEEDEELAYLAETLAERNYYENTRK